MSSSIPLPACRISAISYLPRRHLVPVPSSSRIGYRMISQRNPSHAIIDTMTSASRPASRRTVSPHGSTQGATPSYTLSVSLRLTCLFALLHLICFVPSHRLSRSARCLLRSDPCGGSSSHRLISPRLTTPIAPPYLIVPAPSDETSDKQAKRRTGRDIGDEARRLPQHTIP